MATVLACFIGKPRVVPEKPAGYENTTYAFPAEGGHLAYDEKTQLFSNALLHHLQLMKREVKCWLVMGTTLSMWDALLQVVPAKAREGAVGQRVRDAVAAGSITQGLLDELGEAITPHLEGTRCVCRLVGAADTEESQLDVWKALAKAVDKGDEVVFDITHGLRHQPVIASYMVMLLRWLREVQEVDLYYGAFELRQGEKCPVLKLPICNQLLLATESVATWQHTGNYKPLAGCLGMDEDFDQAVEEIIFADETNQNSNAVRDKARQLDTLLNTAPLDAVKASLKEPLRESLAGVANDSLEDRFAAKAQFALAHRQYFKALALLHEATVIKAGKLLNVAGDYLKNETRETARTRINEAANINGMPKKQYLTIKNLRNAILHGTPTGNHPRVTHDLKNSENLEAAFTEGVEFFNELK